MPMPVLRLPPTALRRAASVWIITPVLVFVPFVVPLPLMLVDVVGMPPGGSRPGVASQVPLVRATARLRMRPRLSVWPSSLLWLAANACRRPSCLGTVACLLLLPAPPTLGFHVPVLGEGPPTPWDGRVLVIGACASGHRRSSPAPAYATPAGLSVVNRTLVRA